VAGRIIEADLADRLPALCWTAAADGRAARFGPGWTEFTGTAGAELAERGWAAVLDAAAHAAFLGGVRAGRPFDLVVPLRAADGRPRDVILRARPAGDAAPPGEDGWIGLCVEVPERFAAERRVSFLADLGERLRREADPEAILAAANRSLGEHLGALRVGYGEVDDARAQLTLRSDWTNGVESNAGTFPLASFGPAIVAENRAGRTFVIADLARDARIGADHVEAFARWGVGALVAVPLVKHGRFTAVLSVQASEPRDWTADELALIEGTAERTWEALERARAEARLRETQSRQAFLLALGDRLRRHSGATAVLRDAVEMLGRHLGADRVGYAEIDTAADLLVVDVDWTAGALATIVGRYPFSSFGARNIAALARGETVRIDDAAESPVVDDDSRPALAAMGIQAAITVPLVKHDRLRAVLSVHHGAPRAWTDGELRLVEEVAERTWAVLERSAAEAELRKSEERLRVAIEGAELGTWDYDLTTMGGWWSPRTCEIYGIPYAEAIPPELRFGLVHPDDLERYLREVDEAVEAGRPFSIEYRIVRPDGEMRWVVLRGVVAADAAGAPTRATGIALDTTERKLAEARLAESEARLQAFLTHAPASMYLKDADGRFLLANADVARRLGVPEDAVVGRRLDELAAPAVAAHSEAREREVLATGVAQVGEQAFELPGGWVHAMATRFPVPDAEGRLTRVGGVLIDITAQKRAEAELARSREALHQSEKLTALGSLLAGVSHELNNPLSIIAAQATMLEREADGTPFAVRAAKIRKAAERSGRIVQTFLAMARQKRPERTGVDMNGIVRAALDLTDYGLRTAGIRVAADLQPGLPAVSGDADQLHQVLVNLIVNAQHALQEKAGPRELAIATRASAAGAVEVEVRDSGPGVPLAIRHRIFEPFYTTKPEGAGTGVGLSFSQGVVEAHGGTLELLDDGPGAAFLVRLPPAAGGGSVARSASEASPSRARSSVLVVDDEPEIAESIADLLGAEGHAVDVAVGGAEAQARLRGGRYDAVLSDLRMPGLDGPALFAWIEAERPDLARRVAFVTGDTLSAPAVRFLARSGCPFAEKPFTPESLRRLLAEVAERAGGAA